MLLFMKRTFTAMLGKKEFTFYLEYQYSVKQDQPRIEGLLATIESESLDFDISLTDETFRDKRFYYAEIRVMHFPDFPDLENKFLKCRYYPREKLEENNKEQKQAPNHWYWLFTKMKEPLKFKD